jgi:hypothetical protein
MPNVEKQLHLKMSTIPTESKSVKRILTAHTYSNVPKRKQARQENLPKGKDRFDPISPAWVEVLEGQENKKKKKAAPKAPKKAPIQSKQPAKTKNKRKTVRV